MPALTALKNTTSILFPRKSRCPSAERSRSVSVRREMNIPQAPCTINGTEIGGDGAGNWHSCHSSISFGTAAMIVALLGTTAAIADTLPLESGMYVLSSRPCANAGEPSTYYYNGVTLAPASARMCHARVEKASGDIFTVVSACPAVRGAAPHNVQSQQALRFGSTRSFTRIGAGPGRSDLSYRLCRPDPSAIR